MTRPHPTDARWARLATWGGSGLGPDDRGRTVLWGVYALMGVFLAGLLVSLIVQGPDPWPLFSDWSVGGFELVAAVLCLTRGATRKSGRGVALALGSGLLMWALGDVVLTFASQGGVAPPRPSIADAFYLGFFPFTYVACVIFIRGEVRRLATPSWLDGGVAGAGLAAVCAAFAFEHIRHLAGGSALQVVTNLAYPVADLLLLGLLAAGSTLMSGQRKAPWILMAAGMAINVVGDTANVFALPWGRQGFILDGIAWPASILVLSMSVWLRPRPFNPLTLQKPATFLIPGLSAACALFILFAGNLYATSRVALALATATLLLVGVRLVLTVRGMRALSQERRDQSLTDDLTGLGNRRCLSTVLDAFFADYDPTAAEPPLLAFLFMDLNHFKEINDTFGHPAGDKILKQLGPRLSACLRETDLLIRFGGDEFVVVLLGADADYATAVAQKLTEGLAEPFILNAVQATIGENISASIGIALAPTDATDSTGLMRCADIAMFRAKLGGTPFAIYHEDLDKQGNRMLLLEELGASIEERQLQLYYQPQLDLRTGEMVSVESLIRWAHPRLGMVSPEEFLPFAEEAGLIGPITTLVLTEALTQCAVWRSAGNLISVSVNISATNLLDRQFTDLVRDLLERHGLPAEALVLEITETSVISEFDRSQQVIQELWDLGVIVSVDDFGAGFTSLAHLSSLAVKELKLDISFVRRLATEDNERDVDLVRATIDLGHALGLRIVAEGIEDLTTLELLADLGCDLGQGYFIGTPVPASQLKFNSRILSSQPATQVAD